MSIDEICEKYEMINYTIKDDGTVDVDGHIYLDNCKITKLQLKFCTVTG